MGMERIVELLKASDKLQIPVPKIFIATIGAPAEKEGLLLAERLRKKGHWVEISYAGSSLRSQLRKADKLSASYVLIVGDDEIRSGTVKWKRLSDGSQGEIPLEKVLDFLDTQR
jgi:histidyl-tRNA synthetase